VIPAPAALPPAIPLWGVWGTSSSDFYIAGDVGYMFHFKDSQWHQESRGPERDIILIWGPSMSNIFAVCDGGFILHYDGIAWSTMTSNTSNHLTGVWGNQTDGFFAVGDNGTILHYDGNATLTWTPMASGTNNNFFRVWVDQTTHDAFAVGTNGMILHYRQGTPQPTVSSVAPKEAAQGATLDVTIAGSNFSGVVDSTTTTAVSFGDPNIKVDFTVNSATQITAKITIAPTTTAGPKDISVTTQRGTGTLDKGFTVTSAQPIVKTITPDQGTQGQTMNVTITGDYLTGAEKVDFGPGITVSSMNFDSVTQITVSITIKADAATGIRQVSVTTPVATDTVANGFTVISAPPQNTDQGNQQDTGTGDDTQAGTGTESDSSGIPVWVWAVVAVGAVALVAGVVLIVTALRRRTTTV
jgi:hypothetical protein